MNGAYYERLAQIESGGDPSAQNPNSSAKGLFQFTSATAEQYGLDDPTDPVKAREAVEQLTIDNASHLQKVIGRRPTDGELYLAHQQGATGALKLLTNPDKKAIEVVGVDAVVNNGGKEEMTSKEFADMWIGKFGGEVEGGAKPGEPVKKIMLPDGGELHLTGREDQSTILKIKQKILEKYGSSVSIDRKTGAHPSVRAFVGSVSDEEDKLASLRQYYPDAVPYGEDNFAYTNPDNGKLTLYNPKGLDLGDWASVSKEAVQVVGGTFGAVTGAAAGTAVAPGPGTVAGGITGSGVGFATAGTAFDAMVNAFGLTVDKRELDERAIDFGLDFTIGAAGEGIGLAVGTAAKATGKAVKNAVSTKAKEFLGGGSPAAQKLLESFRRFGIEPSPGLISNRGFARVEAGLQQNPTSAEIMIKQAQDVVDGTQKAVAKIIGEIGEPKTPQGAGEAIKKAAINAAERFKFKQEKLYTEAFDLIGDNTVVRVDAAESLLKQMEAELGRAPKTIDRSLGPAIKYLRNIVADSYNNALKRADTGQFLGGGRGIEFSSLRQIRTSVGRDLDTPLLTGSTGSQNEAMKRIYAALTEDLSNAAKSSSDEAARKLSRADTFTKAWARNAADTMNKIAKFDADEKAFKFAMASAKDGGSSLTRLRRRFTPEEWDTISASVLNRIGEATPGAQNAAGDAFSINTFLTNWNRLSPEAKNALFGGNRYKVQREALDQLTVLMERVKDASRFSNTSNTSGALQVQLFLSGLGGVSGYLASGDVGGAAKGAAVGFGAAFTPRMAAKLITNPKFVTWLAEPLEQASKSGAKFSTSSHMAGLALIAKEEPDISTEIKAYMAALKDTTQ